MKRYPCEVVTETGVKLQFWKRARNSTNLFKALRRQYPRAQSMTYFLLDAGTAWPEQ